MDLENGAKLRIAIGINTVVVSVNNIVMKDTTGKGMREAFVVGVLPEGG